MADRRKSGAARRLWGNAGAAAGAVLVGFALALLAAPRPEPPPRVAADVLRHQPPAAVPRLPPPALAAPSPEPRAKPQVGAPTPAGEPPWQRFAAVPEAAEGRPRIAIVIDDLGLDRARTARAIALAPALTLSFMAYADDVREQAQAARRAGHELLVHVPMEPIDRSIDMGPNGLAVALPREEVMRRLRWDLERLDDYVGINNHMGSRFTADAQAMAPVIEELKARGLLFLDSRTTGASVGARLAQRIGAAFAERDVFLDDEPSAPAIAARLRELEAVARRRGSAIAIGHPHDATLAALADWSATLPGKALVLVPVTDIVRARAGATLHADAAAQ